MIYASHTTTVQTTSQARIGQILSEDFAELLLEEAGIVVKRIATVNGRPIGFSYDLTDEALRDFLIRYVNFRDGETVHDFDNDEIRDWLGELKDHTVQVIEHHTPELSLWLAEEGLSLHQRALTFLDFTLRPSAVYKRF